MTAFLGNGIRTYCPRVLKKSISISSFPKRAIFAQKRRLHNMQSSEQDSTDWASIVRKGSAVSHVPPIFHTAYGPLYTQYGGFFFDGLIPGGDFDDYLERRWELPLEDVLQGDFAHHSPEDAAKILQTWLIGGIWKKITVVLEYSSTAAEERPGSNIAEIEQAAQVAPFVPDESGQLFFWTRYLHLYTWMWRQKIITIEASDADQRIKEICRSLNIANRVVRALLSADAPYTHKNPIPPDMSCAIIIFLDTLDDVIHNIYHAHHTNQYYVQSAARFRWGHSTLVIGRLHSAGWCANDISMLKSLYTSGTLYLLAQAAQPSERRSHKNCNSNECVASYIEEPFRTNHADGCDGNCVSLELSGELVTAILNRGGLPVICIKFEDKMIHPSTLASPNVVLEVQDAERAGPYVAISHVWSDGLGNSESNSLPICQVRGLTQFVKDLYQGELRPIWIDTFCVPGEIGARKTAIQRMKRTYESADKVLTLDGEALNIEISKEIIAAAYPKYFDDQQFQLPSELPSDSQAVARESLLRLSCSGWMRRLWTLQEGTVSRFPHLYFRFRDRSIQPDMLIECLRQ